MVCVLNVNQNNENDSFKKRSIAFSPQLIGQNLVWKKETHTHTGLEKRKKEKNEDGADTMK